MAFKIGDLVTGTVDNSYGYTTRGAICKVVGYGNVNIFGDCDDDKSTIRVKIIGFDDDMLREDSSVNESEGIRRGLTGALTEYPVKACLFEPYNAYMVKANVEKLNDFLDEM